MTRILLLGASGQVGQSLHPRLTALGEVIVPTVVAGTPHELRCLVLAGMLSFTATAVMFAAVVLVPVMRY